MHLKYYIVKVNVVKHGLAVCLNMVEKCIIN